MTNQKTVTIEEVVSKNPRMVIYMISVLFGLMIGYMFESQGKIDSPLVLIPLVFVTPASIGIFMEIIKIIKNKTSQS